MRLHNSMFSCLNGPLMCWDPAEWLLARRPLVALTSSLLGVIFSKGFVSGNIGVQEHQWVFGDVINLQDEKVPDDFVEGDLGKVDFSEGLHGVDLWLPYKHNGQAFLLGKGSQYQTC